MEDSAFPSTSKSAAAPLAPLEVCKICLKNDSIYVCPRCNVQYCSVDCYKSKYHLNCSEAFYKECIEDDIKSREKDPESQKKMLEILERVYSQSDDDSPVESGGSDSDDDTGNEEDVPGLGERLQGIDLDDAEKVWRQLTEEEKEEFIELVKTGDAAKLVPIWDPWWSKKYEKAVRFVDDSSLEEFKKICPPVRKDILPLSKVTKVPPNPSVYFNLLNVVASYSLVSRYFNGEHLTCPRESATTLISLSKNLSSNQVFDDIEMAMESVGHEAMSCPWVFVDREDVTLIKMDVPKIIDGPNKENISYYVQSALSDMISLFDLALKETNQGQTQLSGNFSKMFPDSSETNIPYVGKDALKKSSKKAEYYQSWIVEHLYSCV